MPTGRRVGVRLHAFAARSRDRAQSSGLTRHVDGCRNFGSKRPLCTAAMPVRALTPLTFATNAARHSPNKAPRTRANGGQSFDLISIVCACQAQAELLFKIYHFAQVTPNDTYVYSAPSTLPLEHFTLGPKTRSRRVAYSFPITHENNCTNPNTSPTKTSELCVCVCTLAYVPSG